MTITITWPGSVPWKASKTDGYSEAMERNVATFEPDAGAPIERRRSSTNLVRLAFTLQPMESDVLDDLIQFFSETTKSGVLPFNTTHPRTEDSIVAKFTAAPQISGEQGLYYKVSIQLMVLS